MTELRPNEAHVWTDRIDQNDQTDLLNDEERERAARFKVEAPRRQFVCARATLRRLLSEYLRRPPRSIEIITAEHGKPSLADGSLQFNVSHTEGRVVLAFAHLPVGVDVERFDRELEPAGLTERFFAPHERQQLATMEEDERNRAFFRCWTQKEAYLKALGSGLSRDTRSFAVDCRAGAAGLLADELDPEAPERWRLRHLGNDSEYSVSLATPTTIEEVRCFTATGS